MIIFLPDPHEGVVRELICHCGRNGWHSVIVFLLINNTSGYSNQSRKINWFIT